MALINPTLALEQFLILSTSPKLSTLSGIPPASTNLLRLASFLAVFVGLHLSFLTGAFAWFIKITKVAPIESVKVFRRSPFLALYFSLFSSTIFLLLRLLLSVALFMLTTKPTGSFTRKSLLRWKPHKKLCFDWSASLSTGVFLSIWKKLRPRSSQWIPTKLTSNNSSLRFNSTPTFLRVNFDHTHSFSEHVSSLKTKFFPRIEALRCTSTSTWGPL